MEDKELMEMICVGNENALEKLYRVYGKMMYGVSYAVTGHHEDAEECCNETLYIVWKNIPKAKPNHLWLYIKTIVYRVSMDKKDYNLAKKRCEFYREYFEENMNVKKCEGGEKNVERIAINNAVGDFVSKLSEEKHRVFVARYGYGLLVEEIAQKEHVSVSKVKMMLLRMRKELQKYLQEENIFF